MAISENNMSPLSGHHQWQARYWPRSLVSPLQGFIVFVPYVPHDFVVICVEVVEFMVDSHDPQLQSTATVHVHSTCEARQVHELSSTHITHEAH